MVWQWRRVIGRKGLHDTASRPGMLVTIFHSFETSGLSLPVQVTVYSGLLLLLLVAWKGLRLFRGPAAIGLNAPNSHFWHSTDILTSSVTCGVCKGLILDGFLCDACGVCADTACQKEADRLFACKSLSQPVLRSVRRKDRSPFTHHWVRGNVPLDSACCVCREDCVDTGSLSDYRCCWCQRTAHDDHCYQTVRDGECDFGKWAALIVPPFAIHVKKVWSKGKRQLIVDSVTDFEPLEDWSPVIVITNKNSGDNEGDKILRIFRSILNPAQVIDLDHTELECGLEWCHLLTQSHPETKVRVLVAGGDGTVCWVLNTIQKLELKPKPAVGILPLGTGNDLSRVLGWGDVFSPDTAVDDVLEKILNADTMLLDRWMVRVTPDRLLPFASKELFMNNYISVGVDALVTLNFHETRASRLYQWLGNRIVNKVLYSFFGTKDFLQGGRCSSLNERIVLEMDGQPVPLPELESIVILNINSWAAGADLWNANLNSERRDANNYFWPKQAFDDQILEVVGLYSSFHIGQLMIGMSEPLRLGQARSVRLKLRESLPMQSDGEPWLQSPATIDIVFHSQASLLTVLK